MAAPDLTLIVKNAVITLIAPGTVVGLVPYLLLRSSLPQFRFELGGARFIGLVPLAAGVLLYFWCLWDFMQARGTPSPTDAPKELVVQGPYRYVRNPMYIALVLSLAGEALLFEAGLLAIYAALIFLMTHVWVIIYEEPSLQRQFGEAYTRYRQRVSRWLPRWGGTR